MATLTYQLSLLGLILCAVQLISSYSFKSCIADPYYILTSFKCKNRNNTKISDIVKDLPGSAVNLTVSFNPVQHIPNNSFAHLPNLQYLSLDKNKLSAIDPLAFQTLHQLKHLNLSFNNLSDLSPLLFQDLHNLTSLLLTNNVLKALPEDIFSDVANLKTLNLRNNNLTNFSAVVKSVSHLTSLKFLDLSSNNLTSLSDSNISLPQSLKVLDLCRNNLHTLGCNPSLLRFIQVLDLSFNSKLSTKALEGVDLRNVKRLQLRSTSVKAVEFLNISNISAGHVVFSGMGLKNDSLLIDLCTMLRRKRSWIKNIDLTHNGIHNATNSTFSVCPQIIGALDLSNNDLNKVHCLDFLGKQVGIKKFNAEHNHITSLKSCKTINFNNLKELSYRYNRILSVSGYAFSHMPKIETLKLNINNIAFLHRKALRGLKNLKTLRLDNNLLTDLFNDTFKDNYNLQILNLRNNRISVIFNETFMNLRNLITLDLGGNKITQIHPSGLDGLRSLSKFYLDGNNLKQIDSSLYHAFQDTLTVLDLQKNFIRFYKESVISPFVNLSKLSDLKLDSQRNYGLVVLPKKFFKGLHSLESLYLTNNKIDFLPPEAFDDLTSLKFLTLDNCCVGVAQLKPGVFKNLRNLTRLVVENMGIQNFSKDVFGNLTKLRMLQLNRNVMQSISVDALESLPKLHYLDMRNVPLSCTCKNSLLQNYTVNNPNVQIVYLYEMKCQVDKKQKFHNFDTKVCYIDQGKYLFFSTAAVIFLFTVSPLLYVKLYWKIKYSYYVFRSWFSDHWRRLREKEEKCTYDAFISYNFSDEEWVMNQLLPNLEGNGSSFKLCLHHRDFEVGRYIVDNIVTAVYSSRKTICVVSKNFLRSEWCSLEIQLASYRLFDEHRDVLLLVFLEPISERQLSSYHRMRKVMLKKTYLQWPGPDCTDPSQAQELFWNQLRRAIRAGNRLETEQNDPDEDFARASNETGNYEKLLSDDEDYLQP
ncbi:toll-like receptor 21 [Poecilia latipinna]|uniref:toll-like receptor 21 n=1 Tax=Poecilia latipinna TaxID=48699 RepID=UPI00072E92C6|nr:PREDICTED: toll-like receptor 13 [Poecilia latipinna]XP_014908297.1 PREDICTED: toll-like receptor 13 [Poecilia latipinna]